VSTFRVVDTTTRWRAGFLVLDEAHIVGPDDEQLTRSVVRHPGAVVVVPVDDDRRHALLVRQYRAAVDGDLLEVVAGKRDVEGEPPVATAARELEEELGHRAGRLVRLCEFYNSPGFCDEYTHLYCALDLEPLDGSRGVTAEEREMTVERVAFDAVGGLVASGALVDAKSIVGLLLTRQFLAGEYAGMPDRA
jgi:8-oxo-dGTP pyrophosphatase MutT (NUDIX family)